MFKHLSSLLFAALLCGAGVAQAQSGLPVSGTVPATAAAAPRPVAVPVLPAAVP
ncbi:MAG: hypothetical protein JWP59_4652, partial [Massilia sp.]|nr:hypothetical protein [Massilia sp.]